MPIFRKKKKKNGKGDLGVKLVRARTDYPKRGGNSLRPEGREKKG